MNEAIVSDVTAATSSLPSSNKCDIFLIFKNSDNIHKRHSNCQLNKTSRILQRLWKLIEKKLNSILCNNNYQSYKVLRK